MECFGATHLEILHYLTIMFQKEIKKFHRINQYQQIPSKTHKFHKKQPNFTRENKTPDLESYSISIAQKPSLSVYINCDFLLTAIRSSVRSEKQTAGKRKKKKTFTLSEAQKAPVEETGFGQEAKIEIEEMRLRERKPRPSFKR